MLLNSLHDLYHACARSIADGIKRNNETGKTTRLILPVGPTEQYSILKGIVNDEKISLKNCIFFFMDEYSDCNAIELPAEHPLSFKGTMHRIGFFDEIKPELQINKENIIFPNHENLPWLSESLSREPVDTCYGGIGIHGHVAFNEPETNVADTGTRLVRLNDYTITINAMRAGVGGNIVNFPHYALTLGMREILNSRRIRLMCRSEPSLDWACTILRIALLAKVGDDFPVTHIRTHKDWKIMSTNETVAGPKYLL
jgi:glucosamine-6-phosphate deaminase